MFANYELSGVINIFRIYFKNEDEGEPIKLTVQNSKHGIEKELEENGSINIEQIVKKGITFKIFENEGT